MATMTWLVILQRGAFGMIFSASHTAIMRTLPASDRNVEAGLHNMHRGIAMAFGLALCSVLLEKRFTLHQLLYANAHDGFALPVQETFTALQELLLQAGAAWHCTPTQALAALASLLTAHARLAAYQDCFLLIGISFLVALWPAWWAHTRMPRPHEPHASRETATGLTMARFPGYWRGWEGQHIETVEVRVIREQSSRVLALMKGDVHYIQTLLGPDQLEQLEKHPRVKVSREESMRLFVIRMHNQREPFTDINVRKAFSHAFNYESFIADMMKGRVARNPVLLPRPLWGYPKEVVGYEYSLDKVKAYLAKAQVKITRPIEIHVQAPNEPTVQAALLLQSDLAKLGIELRVVKSLFTSIVAATKTVESTPDMWIHWISTYFVDPENWIGEMYDSANGGTWKASSWYKNPQVDDLLRQARSLIDRETRARLYAEACHLLLEDAPDLWVYNTYEYVPLAKTVQGFQFCLVGSGQEFWPVYFDERA
jgi:hypothetical protein